MKKNLLLIAYVLLAHIDMTNNPVVVGTCLILGTGYGIIAGPITLLAASDFEGKLLTASQSIAGVLRQVGTILAVAIYVTSLYSNLNTAHDHSVNYIHQKVATLDVPQAKQKVIIKKSVAALSSNKTNTNTKHFTKEDKKELVEHNYHKVIQQQPNLPPQQAAVIKQQVRKKVLQRVTKLNAQINHVIQKIKNYALSQHNKAFIKLYSSSIIFVAISIFSFLLFPKKKDSSGNKA
ncbi:MFS transporter [Bombilactobacillus folatiphilus]|uniref:MFS transporter n=1 Tax=Bombilactobacillus folatiphilus TaxID=2923362 RepID=A0ABY4P9Z6_9LACO|nr:MFS transporter [Bombilactobacillus folatiphilus]UQS82212.1 MFS transporter [Bombilactobacillus folatiphilus]